jgi:hypothetical protein
LDLFSGGFPYPLKRPIHWNEYSEQRNEKDINHRLSSRGQTTITNLEEPLSSASRKLSPVAVSIAVPFEFMVSKGAIPQFLAI